MTHAKPDIAKPGIAKPDLAAFRRIVVKVGSSLLVDAAAGKLKEARQHLEQVNDPAMAATKARLARELADQALPAPSKDDERRLNLPGAPK